MSLGACALLGAICTALAMVGWPYAMQFLPELTFASPMTIGIAGGVIGVVIMLLFGRSRSAFGKFLFFLLCPLFIGVFYYFMGGSTLFFGADWWKAILAAGTPALLFVVCMVILNAMDVARHGFAFWVAGIFFFGIAVGLYFLIKMWIGEEIANLFTTTATVTYAFFSSISSMFPED